MLNTLELLYGKFRDYVTMAIGVVTLIFGIGWYVTAYRLEVCAERGKLVETQLAVSNASYDSVKGQYQTLTKTLLDGRAMLLANQESIKAGIAAAAKHDTQLEALEKNLQAHQPVTNCLTPKDLKDAWNKL